MDTQRNTANPTVANKIEVRAWSGNVNQWRADVWVDGKWIGKTGYCRTAYAAQRNGERIIAAHARAALVAMRNAEVQS